MFLEQGNQASVLGLKGSQGILHAVIVSPKKSVELAGQPVGKAGSSVAVTPTKPATTVTRRDTSSVIAASERQMNVEAHGTAAGKKPRVVKLASWL